MPADAKTIKRIEDLLRLASPSSNSTSHERSLAALRAIELMEDHDLEFALQPKTKTRAQPKRERVGVDTWIISVALDHVSCSACNNIISPRDHVWVMVRRNNVKEYRHRYGSCSPE